MSIAIRTHTTHAPARRLERTAYRQRQRVQLTRAQQLGESRALMRHFALAFTAAGAGLYAVFAAGVTI